MTRNTAEPCRGEQTSVSTGAKVPEGMEGGEMKIFVGLLFVLLIVIGVMMFGGGLDHPAYRP